MTTIDDVRREREVLREFAAWVLDTMMEDGDVDGGGVHDKALALGLIEPHEMSAPCDPELCRCAEVAEFPLTCYRFVPWMTGNKANGAD